MIKDVDGNEYSKEEAEKIIPIGCYCYKVISGPDKKGHLHTKLCPFLDWIKYKDIKNFQEFQNTGYCHFLKKGDWFDEETGNENEYVELERLDSRITVNSKQTGTMFLWDSVKECGINEESLENNE